MSQKSIRLIFIRKLAGFGKVLVLNPQKYDTQTGLKFKSKNPDEMYLSKFISCGGKLSFLVHIRMKLSRTVFGVFLRLQ